MASEVVVYGSSDDLVVVSGDMTEEFNVGMSADVHAFESGVHIALSNGVLLKVRYDGDWNIDLAAPTMETIKIMSANNHGHAFAPGYSDVAIIQSEDPVSWAVVGDQVVVSDG